MKVGVTGATSTIGEALSRELIENNIEVIRFVRKPKYLTDREFDLLDESSPVDLEGIEILYHLAWIQTDSEFDNDGNKFASIKLIREATQRGIPIIFLSSVSVNYRDTSKYGSAKFAIEGAVLDAGGLVIRSGMIWGAESAFGIFKSVLALRKLPLVCVHVQPKIILYKTHMRSLILKLVEARNLNTWREKTLQTLVDARPTTLEELLHFQRIPLLHISLDAQFILGLAKTVSLLGLNLPFRVDSLSIFRSKFVEMVSQSPSNEGREVDGEFFDWLSKIT